MTAVARKVRFFEGSNLGIAFGTPVLFAASLWFYDKIVAFVRPMGIKIEDVYTYIFNLFAIEIGAMLAMFALFVCRPTPFLERIKNTNTFAAITSNTNISLVLTAIALGATLILGLLRVEPDQHITRNTVVFLIWFWGICLVTVVYVRTIRLTLMSLEP